MSEAGAARRPTSPYPPSSERPGRSEVTSEARRHHRVRRHGRHGRAPDDLFGIEPNIAGHAPGRHRAARGRPRRHAQHQDPRRGRRRRREAVAPEGHRPRPPGLDPRAAVAGRRHRPRARSRATTAAHAQEDGAARAALARCPTAPPSGNVLVVDDWGIDEPSTKTGDRGARGARACAPRASAPPRVLLVLDRTEDAVWKSFRNLGVRVQIVLPEELNAYDVLVNDWLVFSKATLDGRRRAVLTERGGDGVSQRDPRDVIIRPIVSEKSYAAYDENVYTFVVAPDANKIEIQQAVESIFNVKVTNVNTLNRKGKRKRNRRTGTLGDGPTRSGPSSPSPTATASRSSGADRGRSASASPPAPAAGSRPSPTSPRSPATRPSARSPSRSRAPVAATRTAA